MNELMREMLIGAGFERVDDNPPDDVRQSWYREYPDSSCQGFDSYADGTFTGYDADPDGIENQYDGATTAELQSIIDQFDHLKTNS